MSWLLNPHRYGAGGGGAFAPTDIAGLDVWYDASDAGSITTSGSNLTQINDLSGNGNHATTVSGTVQSGTDTQNSLNVIVHTNGWYGRSSITTDVWNNRALTLAMVVQVNTHGDAFFSLPAVADQDHQSLIVLQANGSTKEVTYGDGAPYSSGSDLLTKNYSSASSSTIPLIFVLQLDTSGITVRIDGSVVSVSSTSNSMPQGNWLAATPGTMNLRVGGRQHSTGDYSLTGHTMETTVYSSVIGASDVTDLETYLNNKWAIY